ncbi:uncharacterized protein C8Q71DRAFT_728195 [Rhodofomes roseus]|uniref:Uncharacterized protein n=1 Tax=Rhodofomes roseus TaxID=34475 RepID=A0ABQ8JYK4_9APHY|nr:uncharacterized protein C8Q71DRAFT_728195 [Rhodofomes roseus]KAH9829330.1 hypothetical protein C8Q71DRAFT_728195 [Rhodofomes roseus]
MCNRDSYVWHDNLYVLFQLLQLSVEAIQPWFKGFDEVEENDILDHRVMLVHMVGQHVLRKEVITKDGKRRTWTLYAQASPVQDEYVLRWLVALVNDNKSQHADPSGDERLASGSMQWLSDLVNENDDEDGASGSEDGEDNASGSEGCGYEAYDAGSGWDAEMEEAEMEEADIEEADIEEAET